MAQTVSRVSACYSGGEVLNDLTTVSREWNAKDTDAWSTHDLRHDL